MDVSHHSRPAPADVHRPQEPDDLAVRITELQRDNSRLQTAITSHAAIDQAVGVVIALGGLCPRQGFAVLKDVSQHTNLKLRTIAELVVEWVSTQRLPDDVQHALDTALRRARSA